MPKEIKYPWQIGRFSLFTGIEPGQNPSLIKSQDWRDAVQNEALEVLFTAVDCTLVISASGNIKTVACE